VLWATAGQLARRELAAQRAPVPELQTATGAAGPASAPTGTVREQSQQMQQQVKQQVEGLMQQARPMPEDEKNEPNRLQALFAQISALAMSEPLLARKAWQKHRAWMCSSYYKGKGHVLQI